MVTSNASICDNDGRQTDDNYVESIKKKSGICNATCGV